MKKIIIGIVLVLFLIAFILLYNFYRVKTAKIKVRALDDLEVPVYSKVKLSDLILDINGTYKDKKINTNKIGKKTISFDYINEQHIKVTYTFDIKIVDKTPPAIVNVREINHYVGSNKKLEDRLFCADDYDIKPSCIVDGDYDLNTPGEYKITYVAKDQSQNETRKDIIVNVKEKDEKKSATTNYADIYNKFKNGNTKIGLDLSFHQGNIDYDKLFESKVDFVFLRLGYHKGDKYELDDTFIQNIEELNQRHVSVGVYFVSYATSVKEAKKEARWVSKQLEKYNISLPVAYDWEHFNDFTKYKINLHTLNEMAQTFINEIGKHGYKGMLYSSKYYLNSAWNDNYNNIWIANYTEDANYENQYDVWQICDNGKIDGIDTPIDIDIMYLK